MFWSRKKVSPDEFAVIFADTVMALCFKDGKLNNLDMHIYKKYFSSVPLDTFTKEWMGLVAYIFSISIINRITPSQHGHAIAGAFGRELAGFLADEGIYSSEQESRDFILSRQTTYFGGLQGKKDSQEYVLWLEKTFADFCGTESNIQNVTVFMERQKLAGSLARKARLKFRIEGYI